MKIQDAEVTCARDVSGGPVVKNLPGGAGVMGSIPGRGTKIQIGRASCRERV